MNKQRTPDISSSMTKYVLLDFETTGLDPLTTEIIEIGALLMEGTTPLERFQTFVHPLEKIPKNITQLTGITQEMVEEAPSIKEAATAFYDFCTNETNEIYPIVSHHSQMEQKFLDAHLTPALGGLHFEVQDSIDVLALIFPEQASFSMQSFRERFQLSDKNAHRADQDCEDLAVILKKSQEELKENRSHLAPLIQSYLPQSWFWNWMFNGIEGTQYTEELGDLQKLKKEDSVEEADWSKKIDDNEIIEILRKPSENVEYRHSQEQMALKVTHAFNEKGKIAIEAPTGTGKSLAYLLPSYFSAKKSGAPVVVSTHSKGLQDQLLEKDIPLLKELTGDTSIQATTVKGQENYLCLRKLHENASAILSFSSEEMDSIDEAWSIAYLMSFSTLTHSVELDRVSRFLKMKFESLEPLIEHVRSHHHTTIGSACPFYSQCNFFNSARKAYESDIIISNHSLVFHWPHHLPQIRNIVFDEAHHLEDQITEAYSQGVSEKELNHFVDRFSKKRKNRKNSERALLVTLLDSLTLPARYQHDLMGPQLDLLIEPISETLTELRTIIEGSFNERQRTSLFETSGVLAPGLKQMDPLKNALKKLKSELQKIFDLFSDASEAIEDKRRGKDPGKDLLFMMTDRIESMQEMLLLYLSEEINWLRTLTWNPKDDSWKIRVSPIEVNELTPDFYQDKRSIILTSATLSSGNEGDFILKRIGLPATEPMIQLPSPYDLQNQAKIWIPQDIPQPGTPEHLEAIIDFTEKTVKGLRGKTLLLMTANSRLQKAAEQLRTRLEKEGIEVFDSVSDSKAVDHFKASPHALLIGSERYGEGLDIPGETLTCVIIEKINEAMTRGPLAEARKSRTSFALFDYDFPLRMMWLKQRVGRLIRSPEDYGNVVIFDSRYHRWGQKSRQLVNDSLDPMPVSSASPTEVIQKIESSRSLFH